MLKPCPPQFYFPVFFAPMSSPFPFPMLGLGDLRQLLRTFGPFDEGRQLGSDPGFFLCPKFLIVNIPPAAPCFSRTPVFPILLPQAFFAWSPFFPFFGIQAIDDCFWDIPPKSLLWRKTFFFSLSACSELGKPPPPLGRISIFLIFQEIVPLFLGSRRESGFFLTHGFFSSRSVRRRFSPFPRSAFFFFH